MPVITKCLCTLSRLCDDYTLKTKELFEDSNDSHLCILTSWSIDTQLVAVAPLLALVSVLTSSVVGCERQAGGARASASARRRHAFIHAV